MTVAKSNTRPRGEAHDRYMELIRQFPLRPIRTKREYAAATKLMDSLAIRGEDGLDQDELDYLDVLTNLVEAYDNKNCPEMKSHR